MVHELPVFFLAYSERFISQFLFCDVSQNSPEPHGRSVCILAESNRNFYGALGAILAGELPIEALRRNACPVNAVEGFENVFCPDRIRVSPIIGAQELLSGVAHDFAEVVVAESDISFEVYFVITFLNILQNGPVLLI